MKHFRYLKTVLKHKWFVFLECAKQGLIWRGIVHDWHKFLPHEWFPYVNNFYGNEGKNFNGGFLWQWKKAGNIKDAFDLAWLYHQKLGKHHWQYWILQQDTDGKKILPMPKKYATEMVCDWIGASRTYSGNPDCIKWYEENKDKILLHKATRLFVESLIYG